MSKRSAIVATVVAIILGLFAAYPEVKLLVCPLSVGGP